jgi:alkanesulfonate monooxygenase SsuD/methylene tetrahydromethanopterin reductase-like flavin-dependent oxidoreductase (luciferase family)
VIVEWIVGQVRRAAEEAGRDPAEVKVLCCAPAHVGDDLADACEQVRWFPAMVSNHGDVSVLLPCSLGLLPPGRHPEPNANRRSGSWASRLTRDR